MLKFAAVAQLSVARRCLSRLTALEHRLEVELVQGSAQGGGKGTAGIVSTRFAPRGSLEDRPQMPALGHGPPKRAKGDTEVQDPTFTALEDTMDPVAFLETTWNLVLVAGHASVGLDRLGDCLVASDCQRRDADRLLRDPAYAILPGGSLR